MISFDINDHTFRMILGAVALVLALAAWWSLRQHLKNMGEYL